LTSGKKGFELISKTARRLLKLRKNFFPTRFDKDVHRFLAVSEAIAHLDYAETEGKIAVELKEGVEFYRKL
jgi:hypothetical protein